MENNLNNIGFDQIVNYVFGELPETEQLAMEEIVVNDPYYMELVNNLMDYCDREKIYNKEALYSAVAAQKDLVFEHLKTLKPEAKKEVEKDKEAEKEMEKEIEKEIEKKEGKEKTDQPGWIKWLLLPLLGILCYALWNNSNTTTNNNTNGINNIEDTIPPPPPTEKPTGPMALDTNTNTNKPKEDTNTNPQDILTQHPPDNKQMASAYDNDYFKFELSSTSNIQLKAPNLNKAFADGEYETIIPILRSNILSEEGFEKATSELMLAKSLLYTEQYVEATSLLKEMLQQKETIRLRSEVRWFLARAYLLTDNRKSGIALLEELKAEGYPEEANQLLLLLKRE